jgi:hypothetical protein
MPLIVKVVWRTSTSPCNSHQPLPTHCRTLSRPSWSPSHGIGLTPRPTVSANRLYPGLCSHVSLRYPQLGSTTVEIQGDTLGIGQVRLYCRKCADLALYISTIPATHSRNASEHARRRCPYGRQPCCDPGFGRQGDPRVRSSSMERCRRPGERGRSTGESEVDAAKATSSPVFGLHQ